MAEQEHESERIERRDGLEAAMGRPDSPAGQCVDMRMEIEAVAVTYINNSATPQAAYWDWVTCRGLTREGGSSVEDSTFASNAFHK
jgi:hypothetical protein